MQCRDFKRFVYFFLDGSLGETRKHDVDSHLRLCPDCDSRMRLQKRLRDFMRRRFDRLTLHAPDRFKLRLSRSIRAFRAEWSR